MPHKDTTTTVPAVTWICPMHPEIEQPAPGRCPNCGMKLEPKPKPKTSKPVPRR
jgi:Cu+-exporting ATPase